MHLIHILDIPVNQVLILEVLRYIDLSWLKFLWCASHIYCSYHDDLNQWQYFDLSQAERAEKERVKRLTLDINERLEEEDYQEMLAQVCLIVYNVACLCWVI